MSTSTERRDPTVQELFDLTGRVAFVTGGAGYLGTATVHALAEAGASVVLTSRDLARAEAMAAALPVRGAQRHWGITFDVMKHDALEERFARVVELAGKVDILVNNGHHA